MELLHFCSGVSSGTSKIYEVPGRTLRIGCFCSADSFAEIVVFGRSNLAGPSPIAGRIRVPAAGAG